MSEHVKAMSEHVKAMSEHVKAYQSMSCLGYLKSLYLQIDQKCRPSKTDIPEKKCAPKYVQKYDVACCELYIEGPGL